MVTFGTPIVHVTRTSFQGETPSFRYKSGSSHFGVWGVVLAWGRGLPDD